MSFLDLLATKKVERDPRPQRPVTPAGDPVSSTKALRKFVASLVRHDPPVLLDLGPVVGRNVSFFGEQLGCKIFVEDLFADLDRHVRTDTLAAFPEFLEKRFTQRKGEVHGV